MSPPVSVSYEPYAPRTEPQRSRLARIAAVTSTSVVDPTNSDAFDNASSSSSFGGAKADHGHVPLLWRAMAAPAVAPSEVLSLSLSDEKKTNNDDNDAVGHARQALRHLEACAGSARMVLDATSSSLALATTLYDRHAALVQRSSELSAAADRLVREERELSEHAAQVGAPLQHFDAVDTVASSECLDVRFRGATSSSTSDDSYHEGASPAKIVRRGLPKIHVDSPRFVPDVLEKIDNALGYFSGLRAHILDTRRAELEETLSLLTSETDRRRARRRHERSLQELGGSGGSVLDYHARALALQAAALDMVEEATSERIRDVTRDVSSALDLGRKPLASAEALESSAVYTRFHGISARSNRLLRQLTSRSGSAALEETTRRGYAELLQRCRRTYATCRADLLKKTVRYHVESLKDQHGMVNMTRLAAVYLMRLCTLETSLYLDFFAEAPVKDNEDSQEEKEKNKDEEDDNDHPVEEVDKDNSSTTATVESVMVERPSYKTRRRELDRARTATDDPIFQEMLFSDLCVHLHRTVRRNLVQAVDLDTLCQIVGVLRDEWSLANSSRNTLATARALLSSIRDAQERLIFCAQNTLQKEVHRFRPSPSDLDYPAVLLGRRSSFALDPDNNNNNNDDDVVAAQRRVYGSWYPPIQGVLKVLSKIFRVVEPQVFEDMAQQSVQSCTHSLREAAAKIAENHATKKASTTTDGINGRIHADLFLVKHLLILREQLSPFDVQLRAVERQLDFSETGKALTKFLADRTGRSTGGNDQKYRLFSLDAEENALVQMLREGKPTLKESTQDSRRDLEDRLRSACNDFVANVCEDLASPLLLTSSSSSAATDISTDDLVRTAGTIAEDWDGVVATMGLYLDNAATRAILIRPVGRRILRAVEDCRRRFRSSQTDHEVEGDQDAPPLVEELSDDLAGALASIETTVMGRIRDSGAVGRDRGPLPPIQNAAPVPPPP